MALVTIGGSDQTRIEEELTGAVILGERLRSFAEEANSFKLECAAVSKLAERLLDLLRALVRFSAAAPQPLYDRPVRRILAEAMKNLDRAASLVRKCRRRSVLRRVVTIVGAADFRKASSLLEASAGDLAWLQSVLDNSGDGNGVVLTLPPIASNDPILAWVWSSIASILLGPGPEKIEAAAQLASLAQDNNRNKQIIMEEGGVAPLLRLLKDVPEAQIAGATALFHLCNERERVEAVVQEAGVLLIVKALTDSPMKVQTWLAKLVARMAENDPVAQEDFARENAIRPLVTLLSFETFAEDSHHHVVGNGKHQSLHSIVQINREVERSISSSSHGSSNGLQHSYHGNRPFVNSFSSFHSEGSTKGGRDRREREIERPEVKLELKVSCAEALWRLARGSVSNSKRISETKGLLCLAKLVEKEGVLGYNCLMTLEEIAAAAESNSDLRRAAFKTNAPAAKAVVDQLLRVINESDTPSFLVPAIKAIGSLARTFPARETRVIAPLVSKLANRNLEVATEAAIALGKFVSPENFLREAHSKTIIEFDAMPPLMKLLRGNERGQLHGLFLLCYLTVHAGNNEALEQARVLTALEGVDRTLLAVRPDLRELVSKAIYHINLYHAGSHSQRLSFVP